MTSTADFVIRRARREDAPVLGRLGGLLLRVHYEFDRQRFMEPGDDPEGGYAWFLQSQLEDDDAVVLVAERRSVRLQPDQTERRSVGLEPDPVERRSVRLEPDPGERRSVRLEPDQVEHRSVRLEPDPGEPDRSPDGSVVGYVYAGLEPLSWKELRDAAGFIHDVVVDADARGHGVASMLIEAAIECLRARGAPRVMLWTADANADAQRLFTRLGFRRTMVEMTREL